MADGLRRVMLVQHNFVTAKIWHTGMYMKHLKFKRFSNLNLIVF